MTVNWELKSCKRLKENGFVVKTIINCIATNDRKTQAVTTYYNKYDFTGQDFVPFEDLTNDDILNWLFETIDRFTAESNTVNACDQRQSEIDNPIIIQRNPQLQ